MLNVEADWAWPPRPTKAISPSLIPWYESKGYIAQIKKNGTCTVITIDDEGNVTFRTRHRDAHKAWTPTQELTNWFAGFRNTIFIGELLHSKGPSVKDTIYLFDVVRYLGRNLVGTTLAERLEILSNIHPLTTKVVIADVHKSELQGLFHSLHDALDEGVVLKDPKAKLRDVQREGLNSGWMVKCRRSTKNYSF